MSIDSVHATLIGHNQNRVGDKVHCEELEDNFALLANSEQSTKWRGNFVLSHKFDQGRTPERNERSRSAFFFPNQYLYTYRTYINLISTRTSIWLNWAGAQGPWGSRDSVLLTSDMMQ